MRGVAAFAMLQLKLARGLVAPPAASRARAVALFSVWGDADSGASTGDGFRRPPKRPDTRPGRGGGGGRGGGRGGSGAGGYRGGGGGGDEWSERGERGGGGRAPRSFGGGGGGDRGGRSFGGRGGRGGGGRSSFGGRGGGRGARGGDDDEGRTSTWTRRERQPRPWDEFEGAEFVYGVAPVLAALKRGTRDMHALYVQDGAGQGDARREEIEALAAERGVAIESLDKQLLNECVPGNRPHQGLALCAEPLEYADLADGDGGLPAPKAGGSAVWLALDELSDPQNLGALLRSARFLGAAGVLAAAKNSAPLSPVVSKASAGAAEEADVYAVRNLAAFLAASRENGWRVLGAGVDARAAPLNEVEGGVPTILVVGSEGRGLRTTVARACDGLVSISGFDPAGGSDVDSLNVAVAGGILLHKLIDN